MAHHYNASTYYKDLPALQQSKIDEFKKYHASVFKGLSIVELSIFILFSLWDKLADHYVDYTGEMTREEIKTMLKRRAQTRQTTYEEYEKFVKDPNHESRQLVFPHVQEASNTMKKASMSLTSNGSTSTDSLSSRATDTESESESPLEIEDFPFPDDEVEEQELIHASQ